MNAQLRTGSTSIHSVLVLPRRFHRQGGEKVGAAVQGHRLLRKPKVAAFIQREQKTRSERLRMDADEALETITRHARGDIRKLFKNNRLLPISDWPEDVAHCVRVTPNRRPRTRGVSNTASRRHWTPPASPRSPRSRRVATLEDGYHVCVIEQLTKGRSATVRAVSATRAVQVVPFHIEHDRRR